MKTSWICGIALVCSSAAFAQTPAAPATPPQTITLTGCVGGGANSQPITLANAMVIPTSTEAGVITSASPIPDEVSPSPTQPPSVAGAGGVTGTSGSRVPSGSPATPGTPATAGAAPVTGTAGAVGTAGTAGAAAGSPAPTPGTIGTSGTIVGTAPAGSSTSSLSGYRLSGTDMTSWVGRRVQIVGSVVPAMSLSATPKNPNSTASIPSTLTTMPELRVMAVQPITGDCPQK
jgi:hypothetical protein